MNFIKILILISTIILPTLSANFNLHGYLLKKKIHELNKDGKHIFDSNYFKKYLKARVVSPVKPRKQSRNCFFSVIQCYLPKVDIFRTVDNKVYGKLRNGRTYYSSI
uniref:Uncharacterized protein n=1 Tax=Strongyloides stercoralis TaxID=6248 RepID=A0AAF5DH99_STRER